MLETLVTLTLEIPYDGISSVAGVGFALDQFAHAQGLHSFAEWAATQFQKGCSIAGLDVKSDELEVSACPDPGRIRTAFGYDVTVWVSSPDRE